MRNTDNIQKIKHPDYIRSYFRPEWGPLTIVTLSGIIYNIGMTAGPYFEGKLAGRLFDILNGTKTASDMISLVCLYLAVILLVQAARCIKRFYVRRFANDTSRSMRHMLYNTLVHKTRLELEQESLGTVMTKAISDVDACVEGMRKFTTEIFDTGVVLISYLAMLFFYDWRLSLISCVFTLVAYLIADRMKVSVTRLNAAYKKSAGRLSDATFDRVSNAVTYRVYGREDACDRAYEEHLADYEKCAIAANLRGTSLQPVYQAISMCGVIPLLYFGVRNVLGTGWTSWDIAAFTTFLSCFTKMAQKSSSAAKLFNAVQKAQVSWKRIKPLLREYYQDEADTEQGRASGFPAASPIPSAACGFRTTGSQSTPGLLQVSGLSFAYPGGPFLIKDLNFTARPGEIIGITGPVACGKSTLGRIFLCEYPWEGSIRLDGMELSSLSSYQRSRLISYMGHEPELMSDTLEENIRLGEPGDLDTVLQTVCFDREIAQMPEGVQTFAGSSGVRLSGGQQARTALARTLYHRRKLIILDDPFSAVDLTTEQKILSNIRQLAPDSILLLISHRLTLFPQFRQVIWMNEGTCTVSSHRELMHTNEMYAQLFRTQTASPVRQTTGGKHHEAQS